MVDVAEKWFGLKKSDRHKILVEDGVKFFQERTDFGRFLARVQLGGDRQIPFFIRNIFLTTLF